MKVFYIVQQILAKYEDYIGLFPTLQLCLEGYAHFSGTSSIFHINTWLNDLSKVFQFLPLTMTEKN